MSTLIPKKEDETLKYRNYRTFRRPVTAHNHISMTVFFGALTGFYDFNLCKISVVMSDLSSTPGPLLKQLNIVFCFSSEP